MFTDSSQLVYLVPFAAGLLVMMARLDLYISKRRYELANARYRAEGQSLRNDYVPLDRRARYSSPASGRARNPLLLTS
jgi:hypothetical protein